MAFPRTFGPTRRFIAYILWCHGQFLSSEMVHCVPVPKHPKHKISHWRGFGPVHPVCVAQ